MTGAEKVLETIKTPEWKEKADKFLKDYVAKCNANEREMKIVFSNTEYINWLINFTNDNNNFTDEDWDYFPEKISEYDLNYYKIFICFIMVLINMHHKIIFILNIMHLEIFIELSSMMLVLK